ncbi:tRNA (adenosine(37)-N6)-threonylcarbamoyltransferase complex transferase subunit TsaD [Candidatus Giovannonibacteria bacterium RIFCSPLOWO2_12_FULL_44_25]|uniref:tRNA N6-adenosine threonylcarbamoyltransferase n=3 Tax=Parcubacteria group TaxID=1794811 RepID=A0A837IH30_9BACT|nr:MAG: putative tRNA threonylcarbamoyladenosine biosynthesis protein Gcp [Parcubacteria group bacterium GW2011_GWC1_44_10]KKT60093.1 MAG: putative tRNA threonylcarbamoyladenosine biosynthesis protein Gcp [Candidatus Giovannonibacteria bacterium GW2011_GWA1_44_25]KKU12689.1 MAG: putative tRNA threonylcarbamoyladenosine biosynthesis protein Gcp [Candidatus Azambacteria bacterium GW2011_GWC2_45_7b]KKU29940.1 MAG: putative tRNA threonylcarbamoyladenosine biosynthesis protein Gcp [Candidatus Giovann
MRILAIETSCDETAIAILEVRSGKFEVRSNVVLSQIKTHKPFGGVVPNLAMREHRKNLPIILKRVLKEAKLPLGSLASKLDAIAVTYGPGLEPALWEGINFAKDLAKKWRVPLVGVNHLEGHIYASWLGGEPPKFPILALIVSGGHTELVLMKKHLNYKILGETRDDAAGEAFDKVARMLGLGYPGGPQIARLAQFAQKRAEQTQKDAEKFLRNSASSPRVSARELRLPRPMINSKDLNFSFSGLKTAVLYYLRDHPYVNKAEVAYEFQQATVDVLVKKTADALRLYGGGLRRMAIKSLVVGGGVAANQALRRTLDALIKNSFPKISPHISPLWLTGDNAAMIAVAGYFKTRARKFSKPETLKAKGNLKLG